MGESSIKDKLHQIAEQLDDSATWEDVLRLVIDQIDISESLKDIANGNTYSHQQVKDKFSN